MATINLTFNTTAAQDAKLVKVLARINADRVTQKLATFPTIEDYCRWVIVESVKSYIKHQDDVDKADVAAAYDAANASTQASVKAALGL